MERSSARAVSLLVAWSLSVMMGCYETPTQVSSSSPPSPPPETPPPSTPTGHHTPFPALTGPGQVYESPTFYNGTLVSRYVLYDNGTFRYQSVNQTSMFEAEGSFVRNAESITMVWSPDTYGDKYQMTGTIRANVMTVPHDGPMGPGIEDDDWGAYEVSYVLVVTP